MIGVADCKRLLRAAAERIRRRRLLATFLVVLAIVLYFAYVPVRVRVLLWERSRSPGGHIDIFWVGRRVDSIDADLRSLGPSANRIIVECARRRYPASVRRAAVAVIGELSIREGWTVLLAIAADAREEESLRWCAVRSLGRLREANAVPLLVGLAQSSKTSPPMYCDCLVALGRIQDPSCVDSLVTLYQDRRWRDVGEEGTLIETLSCFVEDKRVRSILEEHVANSTDEWIRRIIFNALSTAEDSDDATQNRPRAPTESRGESEPDLTDNS